jgi:hypothetical protein
MECRRIRYLDLFLRQIGIWWLLAHVRAANGWQAVNAELYPAHLDMQGVLILIRTVIVAGGARG